MKRNIIILACAIVAIAAILAYNWPDRNGKTEGTASGAEPGSSAVAAKPLEGEPAPAFKLSSLDGSTEYSVGGKRDKVLIVNFWASWCGPCDVEAPDLQKLYEKYKDKVDLYAVNETKYDTVRGAKDFVAEKQIQFPVLMDKSGTVGDDYKVFSYPISFIISRDGVVLHRLEGPQKLADWEKMLSEAIAAA